MVHGVAGLVTVPGVLVVVVITVPLNVVPIVTLTLNTDPVHAPDDAVTL
jgi:hypothetical protein